MSETELNEKNAPTGSRVLVRKITLREEPFATSLSTGYRHTQRVYGDIEEFIITKWSPGGYVQTGRSNGHNKWEDPKTYILCEVLEIK